jgi:hypothetical protein
MKVQGDLGARKLDGFKPPSWRELNSAVFVFDR